MRNKCQNVLFQLAVCACIKVSRYLTLGQASLSHSECVRLMLVPVNKVNCYTLETIITQRLRG